MDQLIIIAVVLLLVILAVAFFIFRPRGDVDVKRRLAGDDESMPTIAGPSAARKPAASGDADQPAQGAPGGGSGFGGPVKSNATYTTPRFVSKEEAPVNFDDDPPGPLFAPREAGPPSNGDMAFDRRAVRPGNAPIPGGPGGPGGDVTFDRRAVRPGDAPIPGGPGGPDRAGGDVTFDRRAVRPGDAPIPGGPGGPGGAGGDVTFDRRAVRPGDAPIPGGPGGPGGAGGDVTFDRRAVRPGSAEEANDTPESQPDSEPGSGAPPA